MLKNEQKPREDKDKKVRNHLAQSDKPGCWRNDNSPVMYTGNLLKNEQVQAASAECWRNATRTKMSGLKHQSSWIRQHTQNGHIRTADIFVHHHDIEAYTIKGHF